MYGLVNNNIVLSYYLPQDQDGKIVEEVTLRSKRVIIQPSAATNIIISASFTDLCILNTFLQ